MHIRRIARVIAPIGALYMLLNATMLALSYRIGWPNEAIGTAFYFWIMIWAGAAEEGTGIVWVHVGFAMVWYVPILAASAAIILGKLRKRWILPAFIVTLCDAALVLSLAISYAKYPSLEHQVSATTFLLECALLLCYFLLMWKGRAKAPCLPSSRCCGKPTLQRRMPHAPLHP